MFQCVPVMELSSIASKRPLGRPECEALPGSIHTIFFLGQLFQPRELIYIDYHFTPYGFTALYLLSESHLAIHTFPEENKSYIELSSCIDNPFYKFKDLLNKDI